jgi:hypothetical protein
MICIKEEKIMTDIDENGNRIEQKDDWYWDLRADALESRELLKSAEEAKKGRWSYDFKKWLRDYDKKYDENGVEDMTYAGPRKTTEKLKAEVDKLSEKYEKLRWTT